MKQFFKNLKYKYYDFKSGIRNLWIWFPIIWRDRNWDQAYIWNILKHKLKIQGEYLGKMNRHTTAKRDAEIMSLVVKLIDKVKEGYYEMEWGEYEDSDFEFVSIPNTEYSTIKTTLIEDRLDDYFKKYPIQYKKVMNGKINHFHRPIEEKSREIIAMEIAQENHKRCKDLLFKIMNDNIECWWD